MEFRPFQAQMMGLALMFLINIGSYADASSYGEAVCMEKYITKSYFEKYDSLVEQRFQDFVANEVPLGLSQALIDQNYVVPSLSDLHRSVDGEGSHRRLSSSVKLKLRKLEHKPEIATHSCEVVIIERLPSGVFADPFELQHLVQRGVFSDAAVFGDTNLELPSFRSNRSVVEIHMSVASEVLSRYDNYLQINLEVPLHARYAPLGHGFSRVEFEQPDIFTCCSVEGDVVERRCVLMARLNKDTSPIIWDIPCGIKEHARFVSAVTFGFAIVTALLIVFASICYSDNHKSKPS